MKFVVCADPQFGYTNKNNSNNEIINCQSNLLKIIDYNPDFLVVVGDLTNSSPQNKNYENQVTHFKSLFFNHSFKVFAVPGNHDVEKDGNCDLFKKNFNQKCPYVLILNKTLFLFLNSEEFINSTKSRDESYLRYIEKSLNKNISNNIINNIFIFLHRPLWVRQSNEATSYNNIPLTVRCKLLRILEKIELPIYIFSGHLHIIKKSYKKYFNIKQYIAPSIGCPRDNSKTGFYLVEINKDINIELIY